MGKGGTSLNAIISARPGSELVSLNTASLPVMMSSSGLHGAQPIENKEGHMDKHSQLVLLECLSVGYLGSG